jgi:hypothetical protein
MVHALNFPLGQLETMETNTLPQGDTGGRLQAAPAGPAARPERFEDVLARWLVLSEASNSINRCMGLPDLYPFVISDVTAQKLAFVHELLTGLPKENGTNRELVS